MPLFEYKCSNCGNTQEHFLYPGRDTEKMCPACSSPSYRRQFGRFRTTIEYSDTREHMSKVINPAVDEVHAQIGKEALNEDANTLENYFGVEKVKSVLSEKDD